MEGRGIYYVVQEERIERDRRQERVVWALGNSLLWRVRSGGRTSKNEGTPDIQWGLAGGGDT